MEEICGKFRETVNCLRGTGKFFFHKILILLDIFKEVLENFLCTKRMENQQQNGIESDLNFYRTYFDYSYP